MHGLSKNELDRINTNALKFYSGSFDKESVSKDVLNRINIDYKSNKYKNRDKKITLEL